MIRNHKVKKKDQGKKHKFELKIDLDMSLIARRNKSKGNTRKKVDVSPHEYVKFFRWDKLYDASKSIKLLSGDMLKEILKADDELKSQMANYNDFNTSIENIERKESGTLMVKPLGNFVHKKHIISSEHLMSLMVVIPTSRQQYFLDNYELLERYQKAEKAEKAKQKKSSVIENEKNQNTFESGVEEREMKEKEITQSHRETREEESERETQEEEERQDMIIKEEERKKREKN